MDNLQAIEAMGKKSADEIPEVDSGRPPSKSLTDDAIPSGKVLGLASQITPERICCRESVSERIAGRSHESP